MTIPETDQAGAERADYGYDAPGIMLTMLAVGVILLACAKTLLWGWPEEAIIRLAAIALFPVGMVPLGLGGLMLLYNQAGKRRMRDMMLGSVPWTGRERVLDIGTGAGLLLIGAAMRLCEGKAIGIDIWSKKDLSNNSQARTERNIAIEGVADRVEIRTADARRLDMPDASFDRVVSLLCLHNIEGKSEQDRACREIARVLKPGGIALIADYVPTAGYARSFRSAGLTIISSRPYFGTALSLMWMVRAEKPL